MAKLLDEAQPAESRRRDGATVVLDLRPVIELTDDQFFDLRRANRDLRMERTAEGAILLMAPTGGESSRRNAQIISQLVVWANRDRTGIPFDSSGGFILPSGAIRSPDAAWVGLAAWLKLSEQQKAKFIPLCPDFIVELRSDTDDLRELHLKMREYLDNGARLGWLIDPREKCVYVYRPQSQVETLVNPESLAGEPVLKGFVLHLQEIW